jgi:hypothetical protein
VSVLLPVLLLVTAVHAVALASECPQTRAKRLSEIDFGDADKVPDVGTGYGSTSPGQKKKKKKRANAAEITEQIKEKISSDSVKQLELLEHMASKFKTNNPGVEPGKHATAALEVHCC